MPVRILALPSSRQCQLLVVPPAKDVVVEEITVDDCLNNPTEPHCRTAPGSRVSGRGATTWCTLRTSAGPKDRPKLTLDASYPAVQLSPSVCAHSTYAWALQLFIHYPVGALHLLT
eukprot:GHUV01042846.1.p2 GENE.GHUV01042846.1~~GHUV01042846.1.p2  ORF type:complete len:116 (+),score=13.83 GHUV01042846.1:370-717(+)